jgi:hypothetical protein
LCGSDQYGDLNFAQDALRDLAGRLELDEWSRVEAVNPTRWAKPRNDFTAATYVLTWRTCRPPSSHADQRGWFFGSAATGGLPQIASSNREGTQEALSHTTVDRCGEPSAWLFRQTAISS